MELLGERKELVRTSGVPQAVSYPSRTGNFLELSDNTSIIQV